MAAIARYIDSDTTQEASQTLPEYLAAAGAVAGQSTLACAYGYFSVNFSGRRCWYLNYLFECVCQKKRTYCH